jgi:signal transduction histidine kinase/DNA-binding response OmpR family regulator
MYKVKVPSKRMPLRLILVMPFVLQIFAAVGLTGYFSLRNGQQSVNTLAGQLMDKVDTLIEQHLESYIESPHQLNEVNAAAIDAKLLDLQNFKTMGHFFWKQMQVFNVGYINFANRQGEFIGVERTEKGSILINETLKSSLSKMSIYKTDAQGNRVSRPEIISHQPPLQEETWYSAAAKAGKPLWTPIYQWDDKPEVLSVSYSHPIYDRNHKLIGVVGVDLLLSEIRDFLRNLKFSSSGRTFIVEHDGNLVATSTNEKPFQIVNGKAQRLNVLDSKDPLIKATAKYIQKKFGNFEDSEGTQKINFLLNDKPIFVNLRHWHDQFGLDWLVVVVVPQADFMAQVDANTQTTILLCIASLAIAILFSLMTSRWITQPIQRLSQASQAIANSAREGFMNGDSTEIVKIESISELDVLSQSFEQMTVQLKESFEQLETRVAQRTIQLQEATQKAEAANRAKSDFLDNMSHELRTPLNAILGFTQVMSRDSTLTPDRKENLEIIYRSGEHLLSLINDVLDMSKIEAGQISFNQNSFDLYRLLEAIKDIFHLSAQTKDLWLRIECASDVPQYIETDEGKLRQVLINLVGNAIKFTQTGGIYLRAKLGLSSNPQHTDRVVIWFEVEDTGAGIASEELANLFQPFVQTETGRQSQQGTGLGLPISRKFVQLMGGDVTVSSIPNQSTIFKFNTVVRQIEAVPPSTQPPQRRVIGLEPGQPTYRILVVDDRATNRQLLNKLLTPLGFEVCEASNGEEAIALWDSWNPHLIWMDMRMPVIDGYEASRQIKSHLKGQATTIIALTASTLEEERVIVLSAGCDDFIRKPFKEEVIFEKIAQFLGVRYRYESKIQPQESDLLPSVLMLTPEQLSVMPKAWVERLYDASSQLDEAQMEELIAQIPEEYRLLAQALQQKVTNLDFDQIMQLAQQ